jgi:hypothetical protein
MDETTPKSCAADNARSWPVGGMCSETTAPNRQTARSLRTNTASTSRVRVTLFRRPLRSIRRRRPGPQCPVDGMATPLTRAPKSAAANNALRDEPPKRLTGLPAPCLAADPLRGSPSASPKSRPIGQGPFEPSPRATCRPAAAASLAKGRPPLGRMPERAETRSSGRTIRSVTRPLGRPAFRQVHQWNNPVTGRSNPLLSQQKRRLDRLTSRPQPTSAVAIARQRILRNRQVGIVPSRLAGLPSGRCRIAQPCGRTIRHRWRRQCRVNDPAIPGAFTPLPAGPLPVPEFHEASAPARMRTGNKLPSSPDAKQRGDPV